MAWNPPVNWSTNEEVTSTKMSQQVYSNMLWLNEQRPRAAMAGNLSVATGSTFATPTGSWNDVTINVGGVYTGASNIYGTAPTVGAYMATLTTIFSTSSVGKRGIALSSTAAGAGTIWAEAQSEAVAGTEVTALSVSSLIQLTANAKVHIGIRQSSGSAMTCSVRFTMFWVAT
jgi:hypothetical protein